MKLPFHLDGHELNVAYVLFMQHLRFSEFLAGIVRFIN